MADVITDPPSLECTELNGLKQLFQGRCSADEASGFLAVRLYTINCSNPITGDFQERLNDNQEQIGDNLERQLASGKDRR